MLVLQRSFFFLSWTFTFDAHIFIAYKKEGCDDDPGWCFRDAVNNSLPATFYSYGQAQTTPTQIHTSNSYTNVQVPSVADILASATTLSGNPIGVWDEYAPASKTFAVDIWASPVLNAGFKRSDSLDQKHTGVPDGNPSMPTSSANGTDMTPSQRCIAKSYSDGFLTAKAFAMYDGSKLGFIGQYIEDSIQILGPTVVPPEMRGTYRQWFMKGLQDGEKTKYE